MRVLHLMAGGGIGGIEVLLRDFSDLSEHENIFCILWGKDQPTAIEIKKRGHRVIELDASHHNFIKPINDVVSICKKEKIEVIIAHHLAPLSHLMLIKAKRKIPCIMTIAYAHSNCHDWAISGSLKNRIKAKIFKRSLDSADAIIAISQSVKDSITDEFNVQSDKITVIYNGVLISRFSTKVDLCRSHQPLELIYIGRLIEEKGVQNILTGLRDSQVLYHLSIVGDGNYRTSLEKLAEGLNVDFLGMRSDIPELLFQADVFVHLPKCEEGFGIAAVEAMAAGKICICGNRGAMHEIVESGADGFLVDNAEEFRQAIKKIDKMSLEERYRIGENARKKAAQFSIEQYAKQLDAMILERKKHISC